MPLAVFLRRSPETNLFRDSIVRSLSLGIADNAILCSGFFQEDGPNGYRASAEPGLVSALVNNSINLTTVGVHNYQWRDRYQAFHASLQSAGVRVDAYYKKGMKWHAKIFLLEKRGRCVLGIVGSSNVTRPAFGTTAPYNNECDIALWTRGAHNFGRWLDSAAREVNDEFSPVIRGSYSKRDNGSVSISERLHILRSEILDQNLARL